MINAGAKDIKLLSDGWTIVTRDKELSAQFEHTVGITKDGCDIFTTVNLFKFYHFVLMIL